MEPTGIQVAGMLGGLGGPEIIVIPWPSCFSAARKLENSVRVSVKGSATSKLR